MRSDLPFPLPPFLLPLTPASLLLSRLMRGMAARHPAILRRLGEHAQSRILLDVTDAPLLLLMEPAHQRITAHRRSRAPQAESVISGRLSAFLDMLHGAEDGDALFFSRELEISGDTSTVLALRNALDDAELDLTEEMVAETGPAGPMLRRAAGLVSRISGLQLTRQEAQA